jgi:hypothetical protein
MIMVVVPKPEHGNGNSHKRGIKITNTAFLHFCDVDSDLLTLVPDFRIGAKFV